MIIGIHSNVGSKIPGRFVHLIDDIESISEGTWNLG